MKKASIFISKALLIAILFFTSVSKNAYSQNYVVGYFPTYSNFPNAIYNFDLTVLTHIDVAFVNPNASGAISMPTGLSTVVNTAHASNVKVLISIGGGGASGATYQAIMSNTSTMNVFVNNLVQAVIDNNLDGVDVDIEGDVLDGTYVTAAQYETFVVALGTALHAQNKLMTAALANWFGDFVTSTAAQQYDFIGVMAYDEYGSWTGPGQHSSFQFMLDCFNYWRYNKGVPANKLVLGVPFYGYGWGTYNGDWKYVDIVNTYPSAENSDQIGSGNDIIYYNGIPTITQKATFAKENTAGVMIWELTQDIAGNNSLLKAIGGVFGQNQDVPDNLAKGKTVTVSSTETPDFIGSYATDGIYATRWSSGYNDSEWIYVDLANTYTIEEVKITWEAALGKNYEIQTSTDAQNWSTIKTVTDNTELVNDYTGFDPNFARYLRINCSARATMYGYSIYELEVYGTLQFSVNTTTQTKNQSLELFPNPASGKFNYSLNNVGKHHLRVYNLMGKVVIDEDRNSINSVDISHLTSGIYLVEITQENKKITQKLIVK